MTEAFKQSLGNAIKQARQQAGLTQEQLASAIGISTRVVQYYESGTYWPSYPILFNIVESTHVPINTLLDPMLACWKQLSGEEKEAYKRLPPS